MSIPDEAVEAAAEAAYESVRSRMQFPTCFTEAPPGIRDTYTKIATASLEAAAPHIAAQVWDRARSAAQPLMAEAWDEGWDKRCNYDIAFNPYRTQEAQ